MFLFSALGPIVVVKMFFDENSSIEGERTRQTCLTYGSIIEVSSFNVFWWFSRKNHQIILHTGVSIFSLIIFMTWSTFVRNNRFPSTWFVAFKSHNFRFFGFSIHGRSCCRINASRREEGELEKLLQTQHMLEWKQNTQNTSRFTFNEFNCLLGPWSILNRMLQTFHPSQSLRATSNRKKKFLSSMRIFFYLEFVPQKLFVSFLHRNCFLTLVFMISIDFLGDLQKTATFSSNLITEINSNKTPSSISVTISGWNSIA